MSESKNKQIPIMIDRKKMYKYHQENVLALQQGIKYTLENIKEGIIKKHLSKTSYENKKYKKYILIQKRILSGLIISWSENIIKRLFYEPNTFSDSQIQMLHKHKPRQQWKYALQIAYCKAYDINVDYSRPLYKVDIVAQTNVPRTARHKYNDIYKLIKDEIIPAMDIRNKVQHGEWFKAFEPPNSLVLSQKFTQAVNKENIIILQTRINQFKTIYQLIHDLAVSKDNNRRRTFERDFDKNYDRIESNRRLAQIRTERQYFNDIIGRYERGIEWRKQNTTEDGLINSILRKMGFRCLF